MPMGWFGGENMRAPYKKYVSFLRSHISLRMSSRGLLGYRMLYRMQVLKNMYKILWNVYKLWLFFFFLNSKIMGLRATSPPNLNCEYWGRGGCSKFELDCTKLYEMCTKWWHHFFRNSKMVGLRPSSHKFELQIPGKGRVYKIRARLYKVLRNMYKIMASFLFWNSKMVGLGAWTYSWTVFYSVLCSGKLNS